MRNQSFGIKNDHKKANIDQHFDLLRNKERCLTPNHHHPPNDIYHSQSGF